MFLFNETMLSNLCGCCFVGEYGLFLYRDTNLRNIYGFSELFFIEFLRKSKKQMLRLCRR